MADQRCSVMFLIPTLRGGGAERVIVTLLRHFDRQRFQLALAVVDMRGAAYQDDLPADVEVIDLGCRRVLSAMPRILQLVWARRPHVVMSTLPHLNMALAGVRWLLPEGVRYIARETCVLSEMIKASPRPGMWRQVYRRVYNRFDKVICQSGDMLEDLVGNFGLQRTRAVLIVNPVDVTRIRRLAEAPLSTGMERGACDTSDSRVQLLAVGRLVAQKGFDLLIEALARSMDPRLHLTLLGEGPMLPELQQLALRLGVAQRVRFAGFQKNPYPFFAHADAFVLSSRYEGFPNVVLEALVCGTPVMALPAPGGVRALLCDREGCVLAQDVSAGALADLLRGMAPGARLPANAADAYSAHAVSRLYEGQLLGSETAGACGP